jgi:hypothetical protein
MIIVAPPLNGSNSGRSYLFCGYGCVVARTCTCFWDMLAQHIAVPIVGLHPRIETHTHTLRDYNQPTNLAARLPFVAIAVPTPSVSNAVVNLIIASILLK